MYEERTLLSRLCASSITTNSDYNYAVGEAKDSKRVVTVTKDSKTIGTWSVDDKGAVSK